MEIVKAEDYHDDDSTPSLCFERIKADKAMHQYELDRLEIMATKTSNATNRLSTMCSEAVTKTSFYNCLKVSVHNLLRILVVALFCRRFCSRSCKCRFPFSNQSTTVLVTGPLRPPSIIKSTTVSW